MIYAEYESSLQRAVIAIGDLMRSVFRNGTDTVYFDNSMTLCLEIPAVMSVQCLSCCQTYDSEHGRPISKLSQEYASNALGAVDDPATLVVASSSTRCSNDPKSSCVSVGDRLKSVPALPAHYSSHCAPFWLPECAQWQRLYSPEELFGSCYW